MAVRLEFSDRKENIQRADHVVHLRENGVLAIDHGIGSRALLGKVNDRLRFESSEYLGEKLVVGHVSNERFDRLSGEAMPGTQPTRHLPDPRDTGLPPSLCPFSH